MASQRPPWFRFPNIGMRAPAPAPPQPQPPTVRPIPVRAPPPQPPPQEVAPPQPPPSQPNPAPASPPQPPIVRPAIPVRTPPPPPPPQPQQPPPSPPVPAAEPPPRKSPTPPSPVQPRSPQVVAPRSPPPPKEQAAPPPTPPRRSPTPPPKEQAAATPPREKPASPYVPLNTGAATTTNGSAKAATPASLSPKEVVKLQSPPIAEKKSTPVQSPKGEVRPSSQSHHPSPLKLPPAHFESTDEHRFEQKNVLVQEKISKSPGDKMHQEIPSSADHNHHNNAAANGKQVIKDKAASGNKHHDRHGAKMITLAGENKGAVMELTSSNPNSPNSLREKISNKIFSGKPRTLLPEKNIRPDGDHSGGESGGGAGRNADKGKGGRAMVNQSPPTNAMLNSNVQGINNSIVLNSNLSHKDPGVHFSLARKANGGHSKEHPNQYHRRHE